MSAETGPGTAELQGWPCADPAHLGLCSDDHVHADHVVATAATPERPLRSELPVMDGTTLTALAEVCACGSQCLACPDCGGIRCLHCDPLEVNPERKAECCDD